MQIRLFVFALVFSLCASAQNSDARGQMVSEAQKSKDQKDFKKAQALYEGWLSAHPDDLEVEFWYAQVLSWQKSYDEAEAIYIRLLQKEPNNRDTAFALAQLYSWEGHLNKSLEKLDALLVLDPSNSEYKAERERVLKEVAEARKITARLGFDFKSYSFYDRASLGFKASFSYAQTGSWALRGAAYGLSRFNESSGQVAVGGSYWLTPTWVLEADADMSTHSNILPLFSLGLGINVTIAKTVAPSFTFQVSQYSDATVLNFNPGFSWTIFAPLELSAKLYVTYTSFITARSTGTLSGYVKLTYSPFDYFSINLGTAAGENPFDPGNPNIALGSYFAQNLFGGFKLTFDEHFGADVTFNQEWRSNSQTVFSGEFGVFYNW